MEGPLHVFSHEDSLVPGGKHVNEGGDAGALAGGTLPLDNFSGGSDRKQARQ